MQGMDLYETLDVSRCCGEPLTEGMVCTGCGEHSNPEGYLYTCEAEGADGTYCDKEATVEWCMVDEEDRRAGEGFFYCTSRCDDHPETDPAWYPRDIRTGQEIQ